RKASSFSSVQLLLGGVFYVQHLLPLDGHIFREGHGQIAWGKTIVKILSKYVCNMKDYLGDCSAFYHDVIKS
ncbi:MAG: hypothetical protein QM401_07590, partial [Bacillota bacterium]|nr:hypothetical protein [Bacillota bacterium]